MTVRRNPSKSTRRRLWRSTDGRCIYCGDGLTPGWHVDHMVPLARGGSNDPHNLAPACPDCNTTKGAAPLRQWLAEVMEQRAGQGQGPPKPPPTEVVDRDLRPDIEAARAELAKTRAELSAARADNAHLRCERARLEARVLDAEAAAMRRERRLTAERDAVVRTLIRERAESTAAALVKRDASWWGQRIFRGLACG